MEHQTKTARGNDTDLPISERKPPARETFVPEPLLDSWQAAAMMNVHPKTLQKLARQGQIPGVHVGKLKMVPTIAFRRLLFPSEVDSHQRKTQTSDPLCRFSRCTLPC